MFSLRLLIFLFWILYFGLKIIRWTIRKWTSHDRRKKDGNVSETFEREERFMLTDSTCCNKNEVGADDKSAAMDVVHTRMNRLENQMLDFANNMTALEAENVKSEKQIMSYLRVLGEKIDKIEKYAMATKITNESADHKCCGRSAETSLCCADNNKMVKNLMEAFEKAIDESRKSTNEKIDQLIIEIATVQMNNVRNPSPRSTPVPQTPAMSVTPAHPEPSNNDETEDTWTVLQETGSDVISEEYSSDGWSDDGKGYIPPPPQRPLPPLPVTSNNDETGVEDTRTMLQETWSDVISEEYSSDGWSDDEKGYIPPPPQRPLPPLPVMSNNDESGIEDTRTMLQETGSNVISEECSLDGWSDDEKGYIPPPPQRPLPPLPVTSNNDETGIFSRTRPESSNNGETGECSSDCRSDDEIGFTLSPLQRLLPPISELLEDHDNRVQDIPIVVQEFRQELNPEELIPNNSIVMPWYVIMLNKFDSAAKFLSKLARNFVVSSTKEREVRELMEAADDSDRNSEDNISMNEDNEYQRLRKIRRSNLIYQSFK